MNTDAERDNGGTSLNTGGGEIREARRRIGEN
ncbi:hypothetical protein A2U01_0018697 [Trifolium medium]|uniref:Uncharacterized protein n=1 Tax=Trifolium medium TaxID=97028 RepID=A0A392NDS6_9FABA|nr:hypothetical protein [Trifolium medium]